MSRLTRNSSCPNNSRTRGASVSERNQRTNRKWTESEDTAVLNAVRESPHNLKAAFIAVSSQINRTPNACQTRWYDTISKQEGRENKVFVCASKSKVGINRKNCRDEVESTSRWAQIWGSITAFFSQC